ncbi:MAG TPA: thioredoxin [Verrucomicrobiae bacterium]|nr:thioredoxin [Verrucomicrobiae bacterium]
MMKIVDVNSDNFRREVLEASQPVVVDFWAAWCGPCKALTPVLEEIAQEHGGRVKVAKVNVDENPALAEQHHVQSIPTLVYYHNGLIHDQFVGVASKNAIITRLETLGARS